MNLATSSGGTTLDYTYITSSGVSWTDILSQAQAARANDVKVRVSNIPPNATLIWNTIPDPRSTSYEEPIQLAKWQPSAGSKGNMMEFNIDDDPSYKFANGIIGVIKPGGAA